MPENKPENTIFLSADFPPSFSRKFRRMAAASLAVGVLWLSSCDAPSENEATNNAVVGANRLAATSAPDDKTAATQGVNYVLYFPNADAMLSRQVVRDTSTPPATTDAQKSQRALGLLFKKLDFLPKEARLLEPPKKIKNDVVRLNFSKAFLQLDTAPETAVLLILDSISRTLGALDSTENSKGEKTSEPAKILIVVEGKTVREFNQFTLAEPWEPSQTDEPANHNNSDDNQTSDNKTSDNQTSDNQTSDDKSGGGY